MITKEQARNLILDSLREFRQYNGDRLTVNDLASEIFIVAAKYIIENYHPNASSENPYDIMNENTEKFGDEAVIFASALKEIYPNDLDEEMINRIKENILMAIGVCQTKELIEEYLLDKHGTSKNGKRFKLSSFSHKRFEQGHLMEYSQEEREIILTFSNDKTKMSVLINPSLSLKKSTLKRKDYTESVYEGLDPNYKFIVRYNNDGNEIESFVLKRNDIQIAIEYSLTNPLELFIRDIRSIRSEKENRVVCVMNDRGSKGKYPQVFKYEISDVLNVYNRYREIKSIYKNWVLYECFNTIDKLDELILDSLLMLRNQVDVIKNEEECWGAIMSCLVLLDKIILYYNDIDTRYTPIKITKPEYYPTCVLRLLELYYDLVSIYFVYHDEIDKMRTAECHANRARVFDRFFYHDHVKAFKTISRCTNNPAGAPMHLNFLYIYDMHMAYQIMPIEFGLNYDFRMNAQMMHQNRQVARVNPNEDTWDTNYDDILKIGQSLSISAKEWAVNNIAYTINSFCDCRDDIFQMIIKLYHNSAVLNSLPVSRIEDKIYYDMDNVKCFSHYLQIESYKKFGMVKPKFIPIRFKLNDFLLKQQFDSDCIIYGVNNRCTIHTTITEFGYDKEYARKKRLNPCITAITLQYDNESNITGIGCYGIGLKALEHQVKWTHVFMGIPVYLGTCDYSALPNLIVMNVAFQLEHEPGIS